MAEEARTKGISIAGDSGQAQKMGVSVMWSYVPDKVDVDGTLTIQVMKAPFFIREKAVAKDVAALVEEVLGQQN